MTAENGLFNIKGAVEPEIINYVIPQWQSPTKFGQNWHNTLLQQEKEHVQ